MHGFSTRAGGFSTVFGGRDLSLGFTKYDSRAAVEKNRQVLIQSLLSGSGAKSWPLVSLRQIHSDLVHRVDQVPELPIAGDGLVTDTPALLLAVQTADCLPVILVDRKHRAAGVFHAGWRGTVKRIVQKGVGEMRRWFKTEPGDLLAAIGPGIHDCCYQVGEEVRDTFQSQFAYAEKLFRITKESNEIHKRYPLLFLTARAPGHAELPKQIFLDLVEANRQQLLDAGVPQRNIYASEVCTSCRTDLLFSHRAEKGATGRMMAVVGIRERK
ncbi:MAG: peptidoglycan editing factor PgeF [Terriglobales bacterium]